MTRRQALLALMAGTIGILSGRNVALTQDKETISNSKLRFTNLKPNRVVWCMDEIETIELRFSDEKIEIKTKEIFEALR